MKRGEIVVLAIMLISALLLTGINFLRSQKDQGEDKGIPYYSSASPELTRDAMAVYHREGCKSCHSLWTVRNMMESVPAPALDGIGVIHDEEWFYRYFSAQDPQTILPSRLKREYRMPSYARLPDNERRWLAAYMASLKVQDWYLQDTRKAEFEKLTGKEYRP
jgi:cbb3-type cytochrome oxidase cytochrome c subunit